MAGSQPREWVFVKRAQHKLANFTYLAMLNVAEALDDAY